jgi:cytochrome P450
MNPIDSDMKQSAGCPVAGATMALTGHESRLDPLIRNSPFPFYRALRKERPVYYDPKLDIYLVTRYDDVATVLRDPVTYSLEHGYQDRYANGFVDELAQIMNRDGGGFIRDIIACDPPAHTRLRKLLDKAFTAHRVKHLESGIRNIVVKLIEPLAQRGYGDGMRDIGAPLTARIICEQLGMDFEEIGTEKIARWTTALLAQIGRMQTREEMLVNAREMCDLQNHIIQHIRAREVQPREDMMSDLVHARLDDEQNPTLSFAEKVSCIRAMLIAGNDTTAAAITSLMMVLATQPQLAQQLYESADDDRLLTRFVEEILRLEPPVHGLFRTTTKEVDLGGTHLPAYAQVCILFASANDDDTRFPHPRTLDVTRGNIGNHLTFGAGIHRCIGAALARMEIKVAAQEIIKRLDNIKLAIPVEQITYLPTLATHTIANLPLTFSRRIDPGTTRG